MEDIPLLSAWSPKGHTKTREVAHSLTFFKCSDPHQGLLLHPATSITKDAATNIYLARLLSPVMEYSKSNQFSVQGNNR